MPSAASSSRAPNPGAHQESGRMYSARRERGSAGGHSLDRPGALDFGTHGAAIFDDHAARVDVGPNREIQAMTRGRKIADGGRDADAVAPVARPWADAGGIGIVVVPYFRVSGGACSLEEGAIEGLPSLGARPFDPDRSADSMKIAACVAIV